MGACTCGAYAFGSCVCKHVKEHRRLSFRTFDSAKVETSKRVQKNKSQPKNNNILSTDYQRVVFLKIEKNKIRYGILLFP